MVYKTQKIRLIAVKVTMLLSTLKNPLLMCLSEQVLLPPPPSPLPFSRNVSLSAPYIIHGADHSQFATTYLNAFS